MASSQTAREDKDAKRAALLKLLRPLVKRIQEAPEVSDEVKVSLGLKVRSIARTVERKYS